MDLELPHGFKRWHSLAEVRAAAVPLAAEWRGQQAFEAWLAGRAGASDLRAYCACCESESDFEIKVQPGALPDWRETLRCRQCGQINRLRAAMHLFRGAQPRLPAGAVYLTEQTSSFHDWLAARIPGLIGSEYLPERPPAGSIVEWQGRRLRHEDITALSMADGTLAALLSFDVLEHVPDYSKALQEFARVLVPGGVLVLTAPFSFELEHSVIRARLGVDGSIEHLLEPDYHGDPLSADGVLCFQYFGWDLLDALRAAGFAQVELITCWAPEFACLGSFQPFILGWR